MIMDKHSRVHVNFRGGIAYSESVSLYYMMLWVGGPPGLGPGAPMDRRKIILFRREIRLSILAIV
uniref:Uncharacterized protein n=1 Tax=Candidatus Kentrum sp. SD TaxID=2126332 RepID=A0A450Z6P5_9GAMM|nr:MAG: hypothetical protein BECKSD772E_GA0070983_11832 [Candidatus Kentron sp. SD]